MRISRFASCCVLALGLFLACPRYGQAPSKSAAKSITVYQDPGLRMLRMAGSGT